MLTALRILNIFIWSGLLVYVFAGAAAAVTGKDVRRADPWRLSVAAVSVFIVLGNLRWLFAPDNEALFRAVYILGAVIGLFKIYLARTYGRGPKL